MLACSFYKTLNIKVARNIDSPTDSSHPFPFLPFRRQIEFLFTFFQELFIESEFCTHFVTIFLSWKGNISIQNKIEVNTFSKLEFMTLLYKFDVDADRISIFRLLFYFTEIKKNFFSKSSPKFFHREVSFLLKNANLFEQSFNFPVKGGKVVVNIFWMASFELSI